MSKDFLPVASIERLQQRAQILKEIRSFFDQLNFFEVETPLLSHDTVIDRHLQPISVSADDILPGVYAGSNKRLWLQTSPEFGMKRLLAAGAIAIYQITRAFRAAERGRLHNPEFTMLEWYRVGDDMNSGMDLLAELSETILKTPTTQRVTYQKIFEQHVGLNPHTTSIDALRAACQNHQLTLSESASKNLDHDFWLNLLLTHVIEPQLGIDCPVIVYDWPSSQAALAMVRPTQPPIAERFELYVQGMEIANGYHELRSASIMKKRNSTNNQLRVKDGSRLLPEESRLLDAMQHGLPASAGVALGVDRLVMLAVGANSLDEVQAFPIENA